MKAESAVFVAQAEIMLRRADAMLGVGLHEDAARCAYMACFHVAQGYIFERVDRVAKSHKGVQTEFFRLSREDARVDPALRRFLAQAYDFKSLADYFAGPVAMVSGGEAADAIAMAKRFVEHVAAAV